jgi:hypothetical protein
MKAVPRPAAAARFISSRRVTSDIGPDPRVTTAGGGVAAGHVCSDRVHAGPRVALQRAHRGVPGTRPPAGRRPANQAPDHRPGAAAPSSGGTRQGASGPPGEAAGGCRKEGRYGAGGRAGGGRLLRARDRGGPARRAEQTAHHSDGVYGPQARDAPHWPYFTPPGSTAYWCHAIGQRAGSASQSTRAPRPTTAGWCGVHSRCRLRLTWPRRPSNLGRTTCRRS